MIKQPFFSMMTNAMKGLAEIHIITNREQSEGSILNTRQELERLCINYDFLEITGDKSDYIIEKGISIYFDDTDEYFLDLPEAVTVFKIREPWNFDFQEHKWVYGEKTGRNILLVVVAQPRYIEIKAGRFCRNTTSVSKLQNAVDEACLYFGCSVLF